MAMTKRIAMAALFLTALIAIPAALYIFFGQTALYLFSNTHHVELAYKNMKRAGPAEFVLEDFEIRAKGARRAVRAKSARIILLPKDALFRNYEIAFRLTDGFFLKSGSKAAEAYIDLTGLVGAPFASEWRYGEISGRIKTFGDGLRIEDFMASGDEVKLAVNGSIYNTNRVYLDVMIYFSDKIAARMPEQLSKTLLTPEGGGWSSLSVHMEGDYEMPMIRVTSRLFRLNIKSISED